MSKPSISFIYKTIIKKSTEELDVDVNGSMYIGYQLYGSPYSITQKDSSGDFVNYFIQALVKEVHDA